MPSWLPDHWDWKSPDYDWIYQQRSARLKRLRDNPEFIQRVKDHYANNPVDFINDWGMTADPRLAEKGMRTVVPFILFPKQEEFVNWVVERWRKREDGVVEKCRDMGVSWLCIALAAWMILFIPGTVAGVGSRKEEYVDKIGDPKSLFWKLREFINLLPREFQPTNWNPDKMAPSMRCSNPDLGSYVVGEAGDNIGRGNRSSIYFIDESAFLERPEQADAALSATTNCRIHVSTPNGTGNPFYRKAHDGRTPKFVFDWRDHPQKDESWYEEQRRKLDPVVLAQEIDRDYAASVTNAFIPATLVQAAARKGPFDIQPMGPVMVGVDVARFGDDTSVITVRQGRVVTMQKVYGKLDVEDVAGQVRRLVREELLGDVSQIAVDTIGIGAGVADILRREFGDKVVDVNSSLRLKDGENYNLRALMWREMREWLKNGASIPNDPTLVSELSALQYGYRGGLLLIESKDDAKKRGIKSPDRADSIALTFAVPPKLDNDEFESNTQAAHPLWGELDDVIGY
jgi:hypothetical protein